MAPISLDRSRVTPPFLHNRELQSSVAIHISANINYHIEK
jgi:hypothetical protein